MFLAHRNAFFAYEGSPSSAYGFKGFGLGRRDADSRIPWSLGYVLPRPLCLLLRPSHLGLLFVSLLIGTWADAAAPNGLVLQTQLHYYVISNLDNPSSPALRGLAGNQGYAHDSIILAPNTRYQEWILRVPSLEVATTEYKTPGSGNRFELPEFIFRQETLPDTDGDGLHDLGEFILGTDPTKRDTDGDGIPDGAEVLHGTNPIDGRPAATGIIDTASTPGTAVDVCALNDLVIVAGADAGVTVFNVFNGLNPVRIIQVDTPGNAQRVSCDATFIAVADGAAGLAIIDISDPPNARITHPVGLGSSATAVTSAGGIAYVGTVAGEIVAVDMPSGTIFDRLKVSAAVRDLALEGDALLALTDKDFQTISLEGSTLQIAGTVLNFSGSRLSAGAGLAYIADRSGHAVINVADPKLPVLVTNILSARQSGWRQIVSNGSGLGIAAVGALGDDSDTQVFLHDLRPGGTNSQFVTRFPTPAPTKAVSLFNGLAYVAAGASGMHVINYLAFDTKGQPPSISLSTSFALNTPNSGMAEEGKLARITANVEDDVQVRNVEFYIDGQLVTTDGNFPFEYRFITPRISQARPDFVVRAKATDTGGNSTWTDEIRVTLTKDSTPPRVIRVFPDEHTFSAIGVDTILAFFNEPMHPASVTKDSFRIVSSGADHRIGTADDVSITTGIPSYRDRLNEAVLSFTPALPPGVYQAALTTAIKDAVGSSLTSEFRWNFAITQGGAQDDDDNDEVPNEDEIRFGLNPFLADTDGDGWRDREEIDSGTDGTDPKSLPKLTLLAQPPIQIFKPSPETAGIVGTPITVGNPPVTISVPSPEAAGITGNPITVGRPPVAISRSSEDAAGIIGKPVHVADPPVTIQIPKQ
ncbi:MAG: Ig-like domain-containing protein [Verrucomicrobiales bacterium]|nr:Ig-like domain-containing protein [Verrucomicrobiales bacterium]